MRVLALLLLAVPLTACDKITGAADQKIADAEAIGFACRVAQKQPEACMKENETQSPSSILEGWKSADEDIKGGKLDPTMSNVAPSSAASKGDAAEGDKPAEGEDKKDDKGNADNPETKKDGQADAKASKDGADGRAGKNAPDGKIGKEKDKSHG
jgi:hypothetical protein